MRRETGDQRPETGNEKSSSLWRLQFLVSWLRSIVLMELLLSGCALAPVFTPKPEQPVLTPGPQPLAQSFVAGERIIYRVPEVVMVLEALDQEGIGRYYESRGLPPLPPQISQTYAGLFAFRLQLENRGPEQIAFDPSQVSLIDQGDRRFPPLSADELFTALPSKVEERIQVLHTFQVPLLVSFVILQPGERREGLLLFPKLDRRSKMLFLNLPAFYIGSEPQPLIFSFQAVQ